MALTSLATATMGAGTDRTSDASLVRNLIGGSEKALGALYDRHNGAIFAAAMRASGDRAVAAEVVQETFLALWDRAELFDPSSRNALTAWLGDDRPQPGDRSPAGGRPP